MRIAMISYTTSYTAFSYVNFNSNQSKNVVTVFLTTLAKIYVSVPLLFTWLFYYFRYVSILLRSDIYSETKLFPD